MRNTLRLPGFVVVLACCCLLASCGPLRLDDRPHIRGTFVSVDATTVGVRHKTGRTYQVELTADTRIVNTRQPGNVTLCPGQRATVFLSATRHFSARSITLWSGDCK
jgi:hypothetical protein